MANYLDPESPDPWGYLTLAILNNDEEGRFNEAFQAFKEAIKLNFKDADALKAIGMKWLYMDRVDLAKSCFERSLMAIVSKQHKQNQKKAAEWVMGLRSYKTREEAEGKLEELLLKKGVVERGDSLVDMILNTTFDY